MDWEPQTRHGDVLAMALVIGVCILAGVVALIIALNDTEKLEQQEQRRQLLTPTVTTTQMHEVSR